MGVKNRNGIEVAYTRKRTRFLRANIPNPPASGRLRKMGRISLFDGGGVSRKVEDLQKWVKERRNGGIRR